MPRRLLPLALLAVVACDRSGGAIATVRELSGEVTVRKDEAAAATPAVEAQGLFEGEVVSTGASGKTKLELEGGNIIELQPNTSLVVRKGGSTAAEIGAVLLSGRARARSSGGGVLLSIGAPFGITRLGDGQSDVELSTTGGVSVLLGGVTVVLEGGEQRTLAAGNMLQLDGIVVPIGGGDGPLRLDPVTVVLLANPKQVQVQRSGTDSWSAPKKRDVLASGDAIRTRKADGTLVQFGDVAGLQLESNSEVTLESAGLDPKSHRAKYLLAQGTASVTVNRRDGAVAEHEVLANGTSIKVRPGLERAAVAVTAGKDGRVKLAVQLGEAVLPDGTVIDAGSAISLEKGGKPEGEAKPLAITEVNLKPKNNSILYYLREVPPVFFSWKGGDQKEQRIEVARDKEFTDVVFRETISKDGFVYDGFTPGKYFWRVSMGADWERGAFTIKRGGDNDCRNCTRTNVIYDTGEKTVVYYQQALPSITLRWDEIRGAAQYRVKVFQDGNFDTPEVDQTVAETTVTFRPGKLQEGKYYWLVIAQDAAGKDVATGRMNSLEIAYDNAITDLAIKSPTDGSKVSGKAIVTQGEVQLGARLSINGDPVKVDRSGRFRHNVQLTLGVNRLVYRTIAADGIERFYVREVVRR